MNRPDSNGRRRLGTVGGLGPLGSADVFFKLVKATPAASDLDHADVIFEQRPFDDSGIGSAATTARKLYIFDMIRDFERRGVTEVVLPCFLSHTFIDELKTNTRLPIVDMVEAVRLHVVRKLPHARRIGMLASDHVRDNRLFERYFDAPAFDVIHPRPVDSIDLVTEAIYGTEGIKRGNLRGRLVELLRAACADLTAQGADVIVAGLTEIALVADEIGEPGVPLIDSNHAYAQHVMHAPAGASRTTCKGGGGVGPVAAWDLLDKVVRNTPAARDQDHIRILVEQNAQIPPDRTEHLVGDGADPTISLYATCRKLEDGDADLIAIPCNTAHAFVERIQPHLRIPIVNMLGETVRHLREAFPDVCDIGVLATSGTIESGVYRKELESQGLRQLTPDPALQARVMEAIYGAAGVKAEFTRGQCQDDIAAAVEGLIERGAQVIVLGYTELPILLPQGEYIGASGRRVHLVDPTDVLAKRCVALAMRGGPKG